MKTLPPIRPPKHVEYAYRRELIKKVIRPLQRGLKNSLKGKAFQFSEYVREVNQVFNKDVLATAEPMAQQYVDDVNGYHKEKTAKGMSKIPTIDLASVLADVSASFLLTDAVRTNVSLIKSIKEDLHAQLTTELSRLYSTSSFNRQAVVEMLNSRFSASESRARLIARDQTSKITGNLTQHRQQRAGIEKYVWVGKADGRERPTHIANNGKVFAWASPPPLTNHPGYDINCRCTARAVIE